MPSTITVFMGTWEMLHSVNSNGQTYATTDAWSNSRQSTPTGVDFVTDENEDS